MLNEARTRGARRSSLRTTLSAGTVAIVALAVIASAGLVFVTAILHRTTTAAANAVESVRLAHRAKVDMLMHQQTPDPQVRRALVDDMRETLDHARRFITSEPEARLVAETRANVEALADGAPLDQERVALAGSLDELVKLNTAQARSADEHAAALDGATNTAGVLLAALLIALAVAVIVWLRRRAFAPVLSLAAAIERFGSGERDVRAPEDGPEELRDMSRRFNEMATALAEQRRAQMAYLAGVAHDLRNPLSLLKMSADMIDLEAPLPPEPRLRQVIQRFQKQTRRIERMIGDFLDMAKIEAGELELSIEIHELRTVVREAVELFDETPDAGRIVVSLPAAPLHVACDRVRVEQVLTNLISNAIKYSSAPSQIDVAAEFRADQGVLSVTDRGIGMSEEEQRSLFVPFHRGGLAKDAVPGVGLGLSVVRRIVLAHRGRIEIDSRQGEGSTFRVYLPCTAQ
jgi:signal transduction histidine kinase